MRCLGDLERLDATLASLARGEAALRLCLGQLLEGGYATETQYAREELGLSRASFPARRTLALLLEKLPGVAVALGSAQIGVEAALQFVRIATPGTEAAWVERARRAPSSICEKKSPPR